MSFHVQRLSHGVNTCLSIPERRKDQAVRQNHGSGEQDTVFRIGVTLHVENSIQQPIIVASFGPNFGGVLPYTAPEVE